MIHALALEEVTLADCCLTIGVFDGVHRGHQEILRRLVDSARASKVPSVVLTFWPHPGAVLGSGHVKCLTMPDERAALLSSFGVDVVITQPFDQGTARTSARDFIARVKARLGFRCLFVGYDFALGKGREGNAARLLEIGKELDYSVEIIPALSDESGVISSTEIRKLVATGDVIEAANLLGHPYSLHGPVVHGDRRGRDLGFPTANIQYPPEKILPSNGIYACRASIGGSSYDAATNVGVRPQFHESAPAPLVEAHVLGIDRELYGQDVRLDFLQRLRDEQKFPSVQALVAQIQQDVQRTREILSRN